MYVYKVEIVLSTPFAPFQRFHLIPWIGVFSVDCRPSFPSTKSYVGIFAHLQTRLVQIVELVGHDASELFVALIERQQLEPHLDERHLHRRHFRRVEKRGT